MRYSFLLFLMLIATNGMAQKAFRPVKDALKAKNYGEAIKKIAELRTDSVYRSNAKLCLYSIEANRGLNDAENTKIYLKQAYDTVAFFSTTAQVITEAVRLDSIEAELYPDAKKETKNIRYASGILQRYFPNMQAAGHYFYKQQNFAEAMSYMRVCLDLPQTSAGKRAGLSNNNARTTAALYLSSAYSTQNYPEVHRYADLALDEPRFNRSVLKYLAYTAEAEGDTAAYRKLLHDGWEKYPSDSEFFIRLADYYRGHQCYNSVWEIASVQLSRDSLDKVALFAQCLAYFDLLDYNRCIQVGRKLLADDSTNIEVYYYIGASFVNKAERVQMPDKLLASSYRKALNERKSYYQQAEMSLETYRRLAPDMEKRWAPLLYKVYLALNRGKKFAEIEKLLS